MRATADGLNDEVIKLAAEKAALKTEITTRTMACSRALAYKYKTEEAGQYREELQALDIKNIRHEQFENPKPPCVIVISVPLIKSRRIRCLTPQKHKVNRVKYGEVCRARYGCLTQKALIKMYRRSLYTYRIIEASRR